MLRKNLTGLRFERLTVIHYHNTVKGFAKWLCQCDCGNTTIVAAANLVSGNTKSCGCYNRDIATKQETTHGHTRNGKNGGVSPEYRAWCGMKQRCLNTQNARYSDWGGRGITICEEWCNSFEAFLAHIGPKPSSKCSLDRINNDGNYEPGNVRWANGHMQRINRRHIL